MRTNRRGLFQVLGLLPLVTHAVVTAKELRCDAAKLEAALAAGERVDRSWRCRRGIRIATPNARLVNAKVDFIGISMPAITVESDGAHVIGCYFRASS